MGFADGVREAFAFDCEAVVHAGDLDLAGIGAVAEALDRVVGAAVALEHLGRSSADREREQLMAEADAEQRQLSVQHLADDGDCIFARRGGVAGAVREEKAVGVVRHYFGEGGGGGEDGYPRSSLDQVAEDVALGAIVDRDDVGLVSSGAPFDFGLRPTLRTSGLFSAVFCHRSS